MITLKTLPTATAQEVFDQVSNHLLTQMKRSMADDTDDHSGCMYKNPEGLRCAAGCLISPEEYQEALDKDKSFSNKGFEFKTWNVLVQYKMVPSQHSQLIRDLQEIHDATDPIAWGIALGMVAKGYNLTFNFTGPQ